MTLVIYFLLKSEEKITIYTGNMNIIIFTALIVAQVN